MCSTINGPGTPRILTHACFTYSNVLYMFACNSVFTRLKDISILMTNSCDALFPEICKKFTITSSLYKKDFFFGTYVLQKTVSGSLNYAFVFSTIAT
jgi:hypothetical protein